MIKRIFAGFLAALALGASAMTGFAEPVQDEQAEQAEQVEQVEPIEAAPQIQMQMPQFTQEKVDVFAAKNASYDENEEVISFTLVNKTKSAESAVFLCFEYDTSKIIPAQNGILADNAALAQFGLNLGDGAFLQLGKSVEAGEELSIKFNAKINDYDKKNPPAIKLVCVGETMTVAGDFTEKAPEEAYTLRVTEVENIFATNASPMEAVMNFLNQTGFMAVATNWKVALMLLISFILMYLAIVKKFEPLLLLPIAFGMLLTNLPGAEMFHEELFADGHVHWDLFKASNAITPGLIDYLYLGVKLGIYPCLIFLGVGAMTDFGPLIANPKSLLLGAAAQVGIFMTYAAATEIFGFTPAEASSTGIIGGADGPTAIFVTTRLAPHLLGPIAVAAYSYMALVPVIQPPIMKLLTTKKERQIAMKPLREVSKTEKIVFPIAITVFVTFLVPSAGPLVGALMLGNLARECGVVDRISKTAQNELMNIVTIFLGISVGATATADTFLEFKTIAIILMGVVAFGFGTAGGVLLAKFMNLFLKNKINPLIGSAGVSAVPMAARVSQTVGQKENPQNFLLMHAMGPNVAGVIGSAVAAGFLLVMFEGKM